MTIIKNANIPVVVKIGDTVSRGNEVKDLLVNGPISTVGEIKFTVQGNPMCTALIHDRKSGQLINLIGFDEQAAKINELKAGESYSFSGQYGYRMGKKQFKLHSVIDASLLS